MSANRKIQKSFQKKRFFLNFLDKILLTRLIKIVHLIKILLIKPTLKCDPRCVNRKTTMQIRNKLFSLEIHFKFN